jgi:hypothetical protein
MKLGSFEARMAFGLLIIAAPESTDAHEDWNPASEKVHSGRQSLYVNVRDTASGLVAVECVEGEVDTGLPMLFSGELELPTARLKFWDPDETICMTVPVSCEVSQVTIYADNSDEPAELLVQVTPVSRGGIGA